ncbi:hypothetical protein ACGFNV_46725 [Streptomyces sp. NPDC048751]|uniref:hypothetical protein n=1 Tax=Streptomyces sp. NPDC048751 TaxID=3365591 RepID=UPI00371E819A
MTTPVSEGMQKEQIAQSGGAARRAMMLGVGNHLPREGQRAEFSGGFGINIWTYKATVELRLPRVLLSRV